MKISVSEDGRTGVITIVITPDEVQRPDSGILDKYLEPYRKVYEEVMNRKIIDSVEPSIPPQKEDDKAKEPDMKKIPIQAGDVTPGLVYERCANCSGCGQTYSLDTERYSPCQDCNGLGRVGILKEDVELEVCLACRGLGQKFHSLTRQPFCCPACSGKGTVPKLRRTMDLPEDPR